MALLTAADLEDTLYGVHMEGPDVTDEDDSPLTMDRGMA